MRLEAEEKVMDEMFKSDRHIISSISNTDRNVSLSASCFLPGVQPNFQCAVVSGSSIN